MLMHFVFMLALAAPPMPDTPTETADVTEITSDTSDPEIVSLDNIDHYAPLSLDVDYTAINFYFVTDPIDYRDLPQNRWRWRS